PTRRSSDLRGRLANGKLVAVEIANQLLDLALVRTFNRPEPAMEKRHGLQGGSNEYPNSLVRLARILANKVVPSGLQFVVAEFRGRQQSGIHFAHVENQDSAVAEAGGQGSAVQSEGQG